MNTEKRYTVEEAAPLLMLSPYTVRRQINEGLLPAVKMGRRWMIPESAITERTSGHGPARENLLSLDPETAAAIVRKSAETGVPVSEIIGDAVAAYVESPLFMTYEQKGSQKSFPAWLEKEGVLESVLKAESEDDIQDWIIEHLHDYNQDANRNRLPFSGARKALEPFIQMYRHIVKKQ